MIVLGRKTFSYGNFTDVILIYTLDERIRYSSNDDNRPKLWVIFTIKTMLGSLVRWEKKIEYHERILA